MVNFIDLNTKCFEELIDFMTILTSSHTGHNAFSRKKISARNGKRGGFRKFTSKNSDGFDIQIGEQHF